MFATKSGFGAPTPPTQVTTNFFMIANNSNAIANHFDSPTTWVPGTINVSALWVDVAFSPTMGIAIASDGVMSRRIGIGSWSSITSPATSLSLITYGGGIFVVVNGSGDRVYWSTNGDSWSSSTITAQSWTSLKYGNGRFILTSATSMSTSTNAITWTEWPLPTGTTWTSGTGGDGYYAAVGNDRAAYSPDSRNWLTFSAVGSWKDVIYSINPNTLNNRGNFQAIDVGGNLLIFGFVGGTFTNSVYRITVGQNFTSIASSNGKYAVISNTATYLTSTASPTGSWTSVPVPSTANWIVVKDVNGLIQ